MESSYGNKVSNIVSIFCAKDEAINNISTDIMAINSNELSAIATASFPGMEHGRSYIDKEEIELPDSAYSVDVIVKFDTACSRNMSGHRDRIIPDTMVVRDVSIKGFNGSVSTPSAIGTNEDNKLEYFVQSMPRNLALLCAQDYVSDGAAVLFPNDGKVIRMTPNEREALKDYIAAFPTIKRLIVRNRTYEVDSESSDSSFTAEIENAYSGTATRYFNSKVHISNSQERVLATLLTGLSFNDIYTMVKHNNIDGLPRDLTIQALNKFEHNYGRTPDVLQLATPNLAGNTKGYMAPPVPVTYVGQRVEADYFETEFNEEVVIDKVNKEGLITKQTHVKKLASHGNALACFVAVDVYSGKVHGRLVPNMKDAIDHVKYVVESYHRDGHKIEIFAADQGVLSKSMFKVMTPAVDAYLIKKSIDAEISEPYTHNNGTCHIERVIRTVQELMRFAMLYVMNNPNFASFGFTKKQILKCWGNIFLWAINLINLKPCIQVPSKTKYEVYHNVKPDLRALRILPIFCSLYVLRRSANKELNSTREFWQKGLYVGPSIETPGAINAIVLTRGQVKVITTTAIKGISDGGSINPYAIVDKALPSLLQEHDIPIKDDLHHTQHDTDLLVNSSSVSTVSDLLDSAVERPAASDSISSFPPTIIPVSDDHVRRKKSKSKTTKVRFASTVPHDTTVSSSKENVKVRGNLAERDAEKYKSMVSNWKSRSERMKTRYNSEVANHSSSFQHNVSDRTEIVQSVKVNSIRKKQPIKELSKKELIENCCLVDWTTHNEESYYLSLVTNTYIVISDVRSSREETTINCNRHEPHEEAVKEEDSYRAVTENIPKNFTAALHDPLWGEPARVEFDTIVVDTKAVVEIDRQIARAHIENGAEVLRIIPVYEEKIKNGQLVRKVRLVADGRFHTKHGQTYSPPPSREELFILLHIFAACDMDYYFIDEVRAFLNAKKRDNIITLAKFSGDPKYYEIVNALYGMKTASADYQNVVMERLLSLGFKRLSMCNCIYAWYSEGNTVLVYDYVDDFVFGGNSTEVTFRKLSEFRAIVKTTEPELNGPRLLGMEITRCKEKRIVMLTMLGRINDLGKHYPEAIEKKRNVPMPKSGYLIKDYELDSLPPNRSALLDKAGIERYMSIVGCLIWIQGVRMDIIFAVLYLSWFTKKPRKHHLAMSEYCIGYLYNTKEYPLVLGGAAEIRITGYTDASLATGPNSRSITGQIIKLNENAGAIHAKAKAGHQVLLSSFEAELDGTSNMMKSISRVSNTFDEMELSKIISVLRPNLAYSDNEAMLKFVRGEGVAKGVRHMEMRMWYVRDEYAKGNTTLDWMQGGSIPTDKLTKLGTAEEHQVFCRNILGHNLLDEEHLSSMYNK